MSARKLETSTTDSPALAPHTIAAACRIVVPPPETVFAAVQHHGLGPTQPRPPPPGTFDLRYSCEFDGCCANAAEPTGAHTPISKRGIVVLSAAVNVQSCAPGPDSARSVPDGASPQRSVA